MKKLVIVALSLVVLSGCPRPPLKDIADARAALESARRAGAQTYAPREYSSAEGYVRMAQSDSDNRQYDKARVNALTGKKLADIARQIALEDKGKGTGGNSGEGITGTSVLSNIGITGTSIIGEGSLGEGVVIKQLKMIHFAFADYSLSDEAQSILMENAQWMKAHPDVKVQIEGHCDERGSQEYNLALGEKRATSARDYLVQLGVRRGTMSVISYGKEKPLDPAHNEKAWAENRRDEFVIVTR
ncbi:MAG: peptidoglycan-associated lipoprotein Pal [Deltaproteobacteria bacterium]|nr:peptidoglycan-associated lipoprotein Pal [Deltaproteobacteria bacterium]MCL5277678.1 peptidoglycan-associated lipoprotein Pal [Deltaproteobacteria bacterium]